MDYKFWQKSSLIESLNIELIKDLLDQNNMDFRNPEELMSYEFLYFH